MTITLPPVGVILSWPVPNYVNPTKRGPDIYIVGSLFFGLSTIALTLRLFARLYIRKWFGLDDFCICFAWLATVGVSTTVYLGFLRYGWDRHIWDNRLEWIPASDQLFWYSSLFWATSSSFIRLSLLCFYYRLIEHIRIRKYIWVLHSIVLLSIAFLLSYIFTLVFVCIPLHDFWDLTTTPARCLSVGHFMFTMSIINTTMELVIALLPVPVVFRLQMSRRQRWSVISVLSLGVLVFLVGCVRTYYVYMCLLGTWDITWWTGPHWLCSEVENNVAIICACVPALRPVLGRLYAKDPLFPPKESIYQEFVPRRMPNVKPRDRIHYPIRNSGAWADLEGIAHDGFDFSVNIKTYDRGVENEKPRSERGGRSLWSAGKEKPSIGKTNHLENATSSSTEERGVQKFIIKPIFEIELDTTSSNIKSSNIESSNIESSNIESSNIESSSIESRNTQSSNIESSNVESKKDMQRSESEESGKPLESQPSQASRNPTSPRRVLSPPSSLRNSMLDEHLGWRSSSRSSRRQKRGSPLNSSNDFYFAQWPVDI